MVDFVCEHCRSTTVHVMSINHVVVRVMCSACGLPSIIKLDADPLPPKTSPLI
jgi:hypothetical protein